MFLFERLYPNVDRLITRKQFPCAERLLQFIHTCTSCLFRDSTVFIMGSKSSKLPSPVLPVCEDCDKKNQQKLPNDDPTSSVGSPCEALYIQVSSCMDSNHGQITACAKEWKSFQDCHDGNKKKTAH